MGRQGDNNEYAKAGTLRALESKLAQEMKTQEKRLREEIERQAERHRLERDADARNAELERRLRRIGNVLHATLTSSPPTLADVCAARPRTERNLQDVLPPEPREADFTPSGYGLLPIGRRYRDAVDKAEDERAAALRDWRRSTDEIRRQHDRLVSAENAAHERAVQERADAAQRRDARAVEKLAADLLRVCEPLKDLLDDIRGHYDRAAGELVVDVDLPDRDLVPVECAYRVDRAQRRVETMPRPADDVARLYAALAGQVALAVAAICLRTLADTVVDAVHVSVGRMGTRLVEVVVPRSRFAPMDAAWPTPQRWLREFGAVSPSSRDPATRPAG